MPEVQTRRYEAGDFFAHTYSNYDFRRNFRALSRKTEPFPGYRYCIAAAFAAWMLKPTSALLRKQYIVFSIADAIEQSEKNQIDGNGPDAAVLLGLAALGKKFHKEIYLPIGGMHAVRDAGSHRSFSRKAARHTAHIRNSINQMAIMHLVADNAEAQNYRNPSLNESGNLSAEHFARASARQHDDSWKASRTNIAFAYAADSMVFEGQSLFSTLANGFDWHLSSDEFRTLLGRARYACDHVLGRIQIAKKEGGVYKQSARDLNLHFIPTNIEPEPFEPPPLSSDLRSAIQRQFSKV